MIVIVKKDFMKIVAKIVLNAPIHAKIVLIKIPVLLVLTMITENLTVVVLMATMKITKLVPDALINAKLAQDQLIIV